MRTNLALASLLEKSQTHLFSRSATDVACSLRRVPAGFRAIVEVDGSITQTSNKAVSTEKDAVEWDEEILLYVTLCRMAATTFVE